MTAGEHYHSVMLNIIRGIIPSDPHRCRPWLSGATLNVEQNGTQLASLWDQI